MFGLIMNVVTFVVAFGLGYWVCHRGLSGIKSDAQDAVDKVKDVVD